ncbi:MAG: hypothetical protein O3A00_28170, partial [Planctomycetota bacterium]|nr:hypothetical protein [Planctomycetota bacterium]
GDVAVFVMAKQADRATERLVKFQKISGSWRFFDSTTQIAKDVRASIRGTDSDEKWKQADALSAAIERLVLLIQADTKKAAEAAAQASSTTDAKVADAAAKLAAKHADAVIQTIKDALNQGAAARKLAATAEGTGLRNQMQALEESSKDLMRRGFDALRSKEVARRAAAKLSSN